MNREELKHKSTMCGWYWAYDADSVMDAMEQRINELEASQPKWISVEDNPHHPINQDFLIAWERDSKFKDMAIRHSVMLTNDFTHWMPLPPPPKSED